MSLHRHFAHPRGLGGRAAGWVMATRGSNVRRNRWVVGLLDPQPDEHLLEIGCGPGVAMAEVLATGARMTAVDPSEVMRSMATRRNAAAVRAGRAVVVDGSAEALPDGPYAAAFAVNTAMFWSDIDVTLKALADRLLSGGRVALAIQPRFKGATDADALRLAEENAARLGRAGFGDLRVETLALRPTQAGCALGRLS